MRTRPHLSAELSALYWRRSVQAKRSRHHGAPTALRTWLLGLAVVGLLVVVGLQSVRAETTPATLPPPLPPTTAVATPLNAMVGEARTIKITGTWPTDCPPVSPTLDARFSEYTRTIVVTMRQVVTFVPCKTVATPYTHELLYTPTITGVTRVLIQSMTNGLETPIAVHGEGRVLAFPVPPVIAPPPPPTPPPVPTVPTVFPVWASGDITGLWFDPATNGSGLSFNHNYQVSNAVFGTWYVYDQQGLPRWVTLQSAVWKSDGGIVEGKIFETHGVPCPTLGLACPSLAILPATEIGTFRASFTGLSPSVVGVPAGKIEAFAPNGATLFTSNILRLVL